MHSVLSCIGRENEPREREYRCIRMWFSIAIPNISLSGLFLLPIQLDSLNIYAPAIRCSKSWLKFRPRLSKAEHVITAVLSVGIIIIYHSQTQKAAWCLTPFIRLRLFRDSNAYNDINPNPSSICLFRIPLARGGVMVLDGRVVISVSTGQSTM